MQIQGVVCIRLSSDLMQGRGQLLLNFVSYTLQDQMYLSNPFIKNRKTGLIWS